MVPIRNLMDEMNTVFAKGDADAIAEFYTDDAVLTVAGARYEGKDQIREYWRQLCRAFPDRTSENGRGVEAADTFFGEITVRGTHTGELEMPDGTMFPATGKTVVLPCMRLARLRDGKVVEHSVYTDTLT